MATLPLDTLRQALDTRKVELEGELVRLEDELRALGDDQEESRGGIGNHMAEGSSNTNEQERILRSTSDMEVIMAQVNEALGRMDKGTYGACARCGKPVNPERLEAFPYVPNCIDCQTLLEREMNNRVE